MKINQVSREEMQKRFPDHEDMDKLRAERDAALARASSLQQNLIAQAQTIHRMHSKVADLEDEIDHLRHELELPARIANADSAVMQLADARNRIAELEAQGAENARLREAFKRWESEDGSRRCLCCDDGYEDEDCTCAEARWVPAYLLHAALGTPNLVEKS